MSSVTDAYCHTNTCITHFRLEDYLPPGITPDGLIAGLAAVSVLLAVYAIWLTLRPATPFERRFTDIADRKDALRRAALGPQRRQRQQGQQLAAGLMNTVVQRLNLLRSHHATGSRALLAQAGMRSREAMIRYLFARFSMPWLFGFVVLVDGYTLHLLPIPQNLILVGALVAAGIGYIAPNYYIKNIVQKRAKKLTLALPDALDLMVICAEAGLALDAALPRVAREIAPTYPELGEELGLTAVELTFLPDRRQAFENLNTRTNLPGIRGVVNSLFQTERYGTPLAQSLRVLASEFREARITRAEEKAARLPAMLTVPMILFILPTLFIVLLGPAALNIIDTFSGKNQGPQNVTVVEHNNGDEGGTPYAPNVTRIRANDGTTTAGDSGSAGGGDPLVLAKASLAMFEPVVVDVDARSFKAGTGQRIAVVPAGTPDGDAAAMMRGSVAFPAAQGRVFLPPAAPGKNEVRLYYVPPFQSAYTVAARATIDVAPGAKGAVEAGQLLQDAAAAGGSGFLAKYRGRQLTVEGEFVGADPDADIDASSGTAIAVGTGRRSLAVAIGWTEGWVPPAGAPGDVLCPISAGDAAAAQRAAALVSGAPVVVQGTVSGVMTVSGKTSIVLGGCRLAP